MKKQISKLFTINHFDIFKGIVMFFLSAIGDLSIQAFTLWEADHTYKIDWKEMFLVAAVATISYIIKQFFTSNKQPLENLPADPINPQKLKP